MWSHCTLLLHADETPTLYDLQCMSYVEDGRNTDFRLMDHIKPQVTELAIALKFPWHFLADLKTKDTPVAYLLHEWLSRHNQDNSRPTWETLITALKHANLQEEVVILEQHFLVKPIATAQPSE